MIKELFKFKKAKAWFKKLRIAGGSVSDLFFKGDNSNEKNTLRILLSVFKKSKDAGHTTDQFIEQLDKTIKQRKRNFRTTAKNTMTGARQEIRARFTTNIDYFENYGVFDSAQTVVCGSYMGKTWNMKWSEIPTIDKPPRISQTYHPCRSMIIPVKKGDQGINQDSFMTQFNKNDKNKIDALGKVRFEAYKKGDLVINSLADYERAVLHTIDELDI